MEGRVGDMVSMAVPLAVPYPPSRHLRLEGLDEPVMRRDLDGDNFPVTWADDGLLYAGYGDGWGCRSVEKPTKLNTGMIRLRGEPPDVTGEEVAIPWYGGGAQNPNMKGCGLISVDGTLYHFLRRQVNQGQPGEQRRQVAAALIWSHDHGATWQGDTAYTPDSPGAEGMSFFFREADHAFSSPTFLQAGQDYALAQDEYVYVYSPREDLRRRNDHLDLARVPRDRITERCAYELFAGIEPVRGGSETGSSGRPRWTRDMAQRAPAFAFPGYVGAGDVVYWPALGRYVLAQCISWEPRAPGVQASRLALFDAPQPWGPWTTVGHVAPWGGGEDGDLRYDPRLPAKWIAADGTSAVLVFSHRQQPDVLNYQRLRFSMLDGKENQTP
ncbi:MAG: hypothetical protein AVDCRST_MAG77-598 [uncultured Chloroflexi bacterium]|uniref:DUF4185 domain-containing protein n=1 Tax=uncultured Chloroflexota bacterium TaxID=166587 RepID=A0A6J4HH65_9CHLR|nr:MAG: hypothetical protein AVDCRST_MAG77-598 [uncultured Chloroflexota bacterium]